MQLKINVKSYLIYSLPSTIICFLLCDTVKEFIGVLVVYIGTLINQFMLIEAVRGLIDPFLDAKGKPRTKKVILLFVGKLVIIFGTLSFGVHLMGKRVLIPLINYVILIFILVIFCVNKKERID